MRTIVIAAVALVALASTADAKGGKQVFNSPYGYDYSRERTVGYAKDYCEDAIGNHVYCDKSVQSDRRLGTYMSTWTAR